MCCILEENVFIGKRDNWHCFEICDRSQLIGLREEVQGHLATQENFSPYKFLMKIDSMVRVTMNPMITFTDVVRPSLHLVLSHLIKKLLSCH